MIADFDDESAKGSIGLSILYECCFNIFLVPMKLFLSSARVKRQGKTRGDSILRRLVACWTDKSLNFQSFLESSVGTNVAQVIALAEAPSDLSQEDKNGCK